MERKSRKAGKKRFIYVPMMLMCIALSGCSNVNAGTIPLTNIQDGTSFYGQKELVQWYNGETVKEAEIEVEPPVYYDQIPESVQVPEKYLTSKEELTTGRYIHLISDDDISDIRPVYAGDEYGSTMIRNGVSYDSTGYSLGDGWFLVFIPNGTEKISVRAGNVLFLPENQGGNLNGE